MFQLMAGEGGADELHFEVGDGVFESAALGDVRERRERVVVGSDRPHVRVAVKCASTAGRLVLARAKDARA